MPKGMPDKDAPGHVTSPRGGAAPHIYGGHVADPMSGEHYIKGSEYSSQEKVNTQVNSNNSPVTAAHKGAANKGSMGGTPYDGGGMGGGGSQKKMGGNKGSNNY